MHFTPVLAATVAILCTVQADFVVYTVPPIPTDAIPSFTNQADVRPLILHTSLTTNPF
jgi:hypothetical protein